MNANLCVKDLSVAHLQLIVSLIKHGNACCASEELGMSQSTISYHLRRLRTMFNDELFLRTGNGLKPTERCMQIGHFAQDLVNRVEEELVHCGDFDPLQIDRELSLVADDTACSWFSTLFGELRQQMPKVTLCARPWHTNAMRDLDQGLVHFGLHVMENGVKGIYEVEVVPCYRVCIVRNDHPLARLGAITLEDMALYPVILHDLAGWNNNGNSVIERAMSECGLLPNLVARMAYINGILEALPQSNAIAYTSAIALPEDLTGLTLLKAPSALTALKCHYRLYISRTRYGSQETNCLIEFLYDSFQRFVTRQYQRPEVAPLLPGSFTS